MARLLAALLVLFPAGSAAVEPPRTTVTLGSSIQPEQVRTLKVAFEAANPSYELRVITAPSTALVNEVLSGERQFDVVWGIPTTLVRELSSRGAIRSFAPDALAGIDPRFRDPADPPAWVGSGAWAIGFCVRTDLAERWGKAPGWSALLTPGLRIAIPNPESSGTGLMLVQGWLTGMGEKGGWDYMQALHSNIIAYTQQSTKPCNMVASGVADIGISTNYRALRMAHENPAIRALDLDGVLPWDIGVTAVLSTAANPAGAEAFANWAASPQAMSLYRERMSFELTADGKGTLVGHAPDRLAPIDPDWVLTNRLRVLADWNRRFGSKAEGDLQTKCPEGQTVCQLGTTLPPVRP
jgi:iron(III) transport system substrate-binding protein